MKFKTFFAILAASIFANSEKASADWSPWVPVAQIYRNMLSVPSAPTELVAGQSAPTTVPTRTTQGQVAFSNPGIKLPLQSCDYRLAYRSLVVSDSTRYLFPSAIEKAPVSALSGTSVTRKLSLRFSVPSADESGFLFGVETVLINFSGSPATGDMYQSMSGAEYKVRENRASTSTSNSTPIPPSAGYTLEQRCYTSSSVPTSNGGNATSTIGG